MTHHSRSHSVAGGREWHGGRNSSVRHTILRMIGLAIRGCFRIDLKTLLMLLIVCGLLTAAPSGQAFIANPGLTQQQAGQASGAAEGTGDEKEIRPLEPGKPIKRELADGQQHTYRLRLSTDQFLRVIVEQQGLDVLVQVAGAGGRQLLKFDSESRPRGEEAVSLVADAAADYRLVVRPTQKGTPAGSYEIRIEELRAATETDHALHEARRQY